DGRCAPHGAGIGVRSGEGGVQALREGRMDRRVFLETSTLVAGSAVLGGANRRTASAEPPMVGIQVGAVSFVDEGTDKVLDGFQELAGINTLFLATFTYGRGIGGRQLRGQPPPDPGQPEYGEQFPRG